MTVKGNSRSSRPKWYFRCFVTIGVAVLIVVTNTGATSNAAGGQANQVFVQESSHALSAELIPNDVTIATPESAVSPEHVSSVIPIKATAGILPSHVYVLNNREIVTERPSGETDKPKGNAAEFSSNSGTTSHSATIRASVTGASSRLIVVDENDTIVEIWSNTTGTKRSFYSLQVKEQSLQGPEHPLAQEILAQYNGLLGEVDWSNKDRVY